MPNTTIDWVDHRLNFCSRHRLVLERLKWNTSENVRMDQKSYSTPSKPMDLRTEISVQIDLKVYSTDKYMGRILARRLLLRLDNPERILALACVLDASVNAFDMRPVEDYSVSRLLSVSNPHVPSNTGLTAGCESRAQAAGRHR